jgi:hypothetical protein
MARMGLAAGLRREVKERVAVFGDEERAGGLERGVEGDQLLEGNRAGSGGRRNIRSEHEKNRERRDGERGQARPEEPPQPRGAGARAGAGEFTAELAPALLKFGRGAPEFAAEETVEIGIRGRAG